MNFLNKPTKQLPSNPYALPKKQNVTEQLENDAIIGNTTEFTADFRRPDATCIKLYPVAGGVGITTLVQASGGMLMEPIQTYGIDTAEAVFLVSSTTATHLKRTEELMLIGSVPDGRAIAGVVLVHDRPNISKPTVQKAQQILRLAPAGWVIPYVASLREIGQEEKKLPLRFRLTLKKIITATRVAGQKG
jgi:hypothetical protein